MGISDRTAWNQFTMILAISHVSQSTSISCITEYQGIQDWPSGFDLEHFVVFWHASLSHAPQVIGSAVLWWNILVVACMRSSTLGPWSWWGSDTLTPTYGSRQYTNKKKSGSWISPWYWPCAMHQASHSRANPKICFTLQRKIAIKMLILLIIGTL